MFRTNAETEVRFHLWNCKRSLISLLIIAIINKTDKNKNDQKLLLWLELQVKLYIGIISTIRPYRTAERTEETRAILQSVTITLGASEIQRRGLRFSCRHVPLSPASGFTTAFKFWRATGSVYQRQKVRRSCTRTFRSRHVFHVFLRAHPRRRLHRRIKIPFSRSNGLRSPCTRRGRNVLILCIALCSWKVRGLVESHVWSSQGEKEQGWLIESNLMGTGWHID